jgi:hypothetical protein
MPRGKNKSRIVDHQLLQHRGRQWRYRGRLYADHLDIDKISGDLSAPAAELDAAIKAECKRLGVVINLNDRAVADMMLKSIAVALP